eukprot:SAG11_NODE_2059_length_3874_cov_1.709139_4_plen_65_part_00
MVSLPRTMACALERESGQLPRRLGALTAQRSARTFAHLHLLAPSPAPSASRRSASAFGVGAIAT